MKNIIYFIDTNLPKEPITTTPQQQQQHQGHPEACVSSASLSLPNTNTNLVSIQSTVTEFIAKTEMNERSIATAWVGLVGALLLIPIAWILGKFF